MWEVWARNDQGELGTITSGWPTRESALGMAAGYITFYDELIIVSPSGVVETLTKHDIANEIVNAERGL